MNKLPLQRIRFRVVCTVLMNEPRIFDVCMCENKLKTTPTVTV